jgi:hypothetical protein
MSTSAIWSNCVPIVYRYYTVHYWDLTRLQLEYCYIANFDGLIRIEPQKQEVSAKESRFHASTSGVRS